MGKLGNIYTATFSAVAVSAAQDVFELVTPARVRARIREVRLGQYTDFGDAQAEILSVLFATGYTVSGTGGTTVTPSGLGSVSTVASLCTVEANNTTVANTGTASVKLADVMNVAAGFWYRPDEEEMIWIPASTRAVIRLTAPADAITMNGTLIYEEMGLVA